MAPGRDCPTPSLLWVGSGSLPNSAVAVKDRQADGSVILTLVARDEHSGVGGIEYSTDEGKTWQPYTESLHLRNAGIHRTKVAAFDQAGNRSVDQEISVRID